MSQNPAVVHTFS